MACGAVAIARIVHIVRGSLRGNAVAGRAEIAGSVVAFQAECEDDGAFEQPRVEGSVRIVAALAAIDAERRVFERKRASLVRVAAETWLFAIAGVLDHARPEAAAPCGRFGAMGIVAIAARHAAFVDPVLVGHRKLGANRGVAAVTEIGLTFREKKFGCRGAMDRVAAYAGDIGLGVRTSLDLVSIEVLAVAGEAIVESLLGTHLGKGSDGGFAAARLDVSFPRAVAAFATGSLGRRFSRSDRAIVGVPVEVQPNIRVAGLADVRANIAGSW